MRRFIQVLWAAVGVGLLGYAGLTLWLAYSGTFFPHLLDYGEGDVRWFTHQLAVGLPMYYAAPPPYATNNYPPVYMALAGSLDWLLGLQYIWGRWLNFAATLIVTAFIANWVWRITRDKRAAPLAALFFFGSTFVYHWVPLFRVDMPGVAFTFAGIALMWRWERRVAGARATTWMPLALAGIFFLLAFYTKQSLVFGPAAAFAAIFLRDRRTALIWGVTLALVGGALFAALEIGTRGGWSFGILTSNATVWTPQVFIPLITSFVITYAVLLALGALGWWTRVMGSPPQRGVLEIYAVAGLLSLGLAGREGAWENYFFEAIAMVCVYAGIFIAQLWNTPRAQIALPALLLVQLALFWNEHDPRIAEKLFEQARIGNDHVAPLVRAASGTLISEDMGLLFMNGKPVEYYSFPYSTLARAGRWDQHWEVDNLRAGAFPLVILLQGTRIDVDRDRNFTRAFMSALDYGYAVTTEDVRYQVYAPAPLAHRTPRATLGDLFELEGWTLAPGELKAGTNLELTLVWRALAQPRLRYTAFAHLEDANGGVLAQDDHEPKAAAYPTTKWGADEMVRDTFRLRVPPDLSAGSYLLRVGWYETASQDRLSQPDGTDMVTLEQFQVE